MTKANTVVLGIGFPTVIPDNGVNAMQVADVDGVRIKGLLFDAGTTNSAALLTVGPSGSTASHAANPTTIQDVFFRIGGASVGKATTSLVVNSNDAIIDHTWAWRADHGNAGTVGWTINTADTGVLVNGNNVLATGLFVEHYQKYRGDLERPGRQDHLLPERDAVRRAGPGVVDQRPPASTASPPTRWATNVTSHEAGAWAATASSTSTRR